MIIFEREKVDLTAEIKISENVLSLLGTPYMESGMGLTNVCVYSMKQSVCAFTYVCVAGDSKVTSSSGDVFH